MGRPHCLFDLQQVIGELFQHLLPQHKFIHDEWYGCRTNGRQFLIVKGFASLRPFCSPQVDFSMGRVLPVVNSPKPNEARPPRISMQATNFDGILCMMAAGRTMPLANVRATTQNCTKLDRVPP